jgi:hypothetical protein
MLHLNANHHQLLPLPLRACPAGAPRQRVMGQFFRQIAKCLGCRTSMPGFKGDVADAPGLCANCAG